VTESYDLAAERTQRWKDPGLAIDWPLDAGLDPILSPKDAAAAAFAECEKSD